MANFFTKQQIDDIRTALASDAKSDLEFPETTEITNNDYIAIVQNGLNKKIKADSFKGETGATGPQGPQGPQGIQGPEGQQGPQGDPGITSATVSVDNTSGTPTATATITNQNLNIAFTGLKGQQGPQGPAGQDGRDGSDADVTAINIANALGYTPASQDSDAVAGNVAEFDSSGNPVDSGVAADNIAEQDGYYETMVVGGAENLIGNDIVSSQFTRRKTGGSTDVGTGVAILKTIKGNTLVMNQMIPNGDFSTADLYWNNQGYLPIISISGGELIAEATRADGIWVHYPNFEYLPNHILLVSVIVRADASCSLTTRLTKISPSSVQNTSLGTAGTSKSHLSALITKTTDAQDFSIYSSNLTIGDKVYFDSIAIIDLTQMFGAGNEPSSVAEFEALFPLNYYAYDSGSLLNLTATGLQTNGFNQWDEEWEEGTIVATDGQNAPSTGELRSKNYISVFPGATYFVKVPQTTYLRFYDIDKNYIGYRDAANKANRLNNEMIIPTNAYYFRFVVSPYTVPYNNDICINLSDVNKDGTYEPYWSETKALPITTATSGGVAIFSDGMKSAGTAYDKFYKSAGSDLFDKAQRVIGKVDLGSLTWSYSSANGFNAEIPNIAPSTSAHYLQIKCSQYQPLNVTYATWAASDKAMYGNPIAISAANANRLFIRDSSYTDKDTFKAAMSGVYLYYELANYEDFTLETPFSGNYKIDGFGTETILPENTSTPTTSPIVADINYALNAIDTIRNLPQNYISKASMDAILTAFKTAGVITNYTLTWDATNQKYNCTITA